MTAARLMLIAAALAVPAAAWPFAYLAQNPVPGGEPLDKQSSGEPVVWADQAVVINLNLDSRGAGFNRVAAEVLGEWNAVGTRLQWQAGDARVPEDSLCGEPPAVAGQPRPEPVKVAFWRAFVTCTGDGFGDDVLAVTHRYSEQTEGEPWHIVDVAVVMNSSPSLSWAPEQDQAVTTDFLGRETHDFRRVFLHEMGHAAGLEHPDETVPPQTVTAIMNSRVGDINRLQADDIAGLSFLYAGSGNNNANTNGNTGSSTSSGGASGGGATGGAAAGLLLGLWLLGRRVRVQSSPKSSFK
ncbi:MAG TPA: matrixin family metalloprotease [Gammaproteobacteria bacterium]|nr:matrixin family metalloprotease [Gammaproteobacteria bacterium]